MNAATRSMLAVLASWSCSSDSSIIDRWEVTDVTPMEASGSSDGEGCMDVDDDLSGSLSATFISGVDLVTFTGTGDKTRYTFTLSNGEELTCAWPEDVLRCTLGIPGAEPHTRIEFERHFCSMPTPGFGWGGRGKRG